MQDRQNSRRKVFQRGKFTDSQLGYIWRHSCAAGWSPLTTHRGFGRPSSAEPGLGPQACFCPPRQRTAPCHRIGQHDFASCVDTWSWEGSLERPFRMARNFSVEKQQSIRAGHWMLENPSAESFPRGRSASLPETALRGGPADPPKDAGCYIEQRAGIIAIPWRGLPGSFR